MHIMGVQAVLVVLVLFTATVKSESGAVSFWGKEVTLTCPGAVSWFKKGGDPLRNETKETYTYTYDSKGSYYCLYESPDNTGEKHIYHFYVEAKVCDDCFELDAFLFGLALIADMVLTIFVMMVIYKYTEKKTSAGPAPSSRARGHTGGQAPPLPSSSEYSTLNPHTRSQGVYSTVVNRTG